MGKDVTEIAELKRQGLSIQTISAITGFDRKTIRRNLRESEVQPEYGPRPKPPSLLDPFTPYLQERLQAGV
jgi:transposase